MIIFVPQSIEQESNNNSATVLGHYKRDNRPQTWTKDHINELNMLLSF